MVPGPGWTSGLEERWISNALLAPPKQPEINVYRFLAISSGKKAGLTGGG